MLYQRFYPLKGESNGNSETFVKYLYPSEKEAEPIMGSNISAAQLQGYFMQYKFDENEAIKNVHELTK